jgi:2-oxoglutarate ferredoxin oxidoreductase subunit alpha
VGIGGQAGFGIKASGQTLARAMASAGFHTFDLTEYPSLIRGGHNYYALRVGRDRLYSHVLEVDVLVALNQDTVDLHSDALTEGAAVVFDPDVVEADTVLGAALGVPVPLEDLARDIGKPIMRNTVANGAVVALLGLPLELLETSIARQFAAKDASVTEANVEAARAGFEAAADAARDFGQTLETPKEPDSDRILIDGNSAVGLGALAAGIGLYAAYPMTPASSLLHFMAAHERDTGVVVKHVEDELAAMNMVVGGAFTGARSMCATSGGGFALMSEAFGLAGVSESAVVVMVSQRPGPATGLPTWTEQSDLRTVLHAAQGEFPRIVLAPGDHEDCFELAWRAFNLADKLQTPVVLLLDNYLSENRADVTAFHASAVEIDRGDIVVEGSVEDYRRYQVTDSGVSRRAVAGVEGALQVVNSYDHDEYGFASEEPDVRIAQNEKRMRKEATAADLVPSPWVEGDADAAVSIVCWGSTKMPVREAVSWLAADGVSSRIMHVRTLWPFPAQAVSSFIEEAREAGSPVVVIEGNATGQLEGLIRQECLHVPEARCRRYDGRPFSPEVVAEFLEGVVTDA